MTAQIADISRRVLGPESGPGRERMTDCRRSNLSLPSNRFSGQPSWSNLYAPKTANPMTWTSAILDRINEAYSSLDRSNPQTEEWLFKCLAAFASSMVHLRANGENSWLGTALDGRELAGNVMMKLDYYRGDSKFSTWAYRVIWNDISMFLRRELRRLDTHSYQTGDSCYEEDVKQIPDTADSSHAVCLEGNLLEGLEPEKRAMLEMVMEGYDYSEIAKRFGIAVGTVKSRVYRIRDELRSELDGETE